MSEAKCPHCGEVLSGISNLTGEQKPAPGDPIACIFCGAIMTVDDSGNLCPFSEEQAAIFLNES